MQKESDREFTCLVENFEFEEATISCCPNNLQAICTYPSFTFPQSSVTMAPAIIEMVEKPRRPLSAYNLFFKQERQKMVAEGNKKAFGDVAKYIGEKWSA